MATRPFKYPRLTSGANGGRDSHGAVPVQRAKRAELVIPMARCLRSEWSERSELSDASSELPLVGIAHTYK